MKINTLWGEEDLDESKVCRLCGEDKPYSEYCPKLDRRDKLDSRCKSCIRKGQSLRAQLRKNAGPAPDVCQLCGRESEYNLVVDHCHETNTFRGYICKSCNTGLGAFGDTLEDVIKAKIYLETHREYLKNNPEVLKCLI